MRDSAVMMSSTMPSAKYSCSGSPLILVNGRTAMEGLSGTSKPVRGAAVGARRRRAAIEQRAPGPHRLGNVLERLLAQIVPGDLDLAAHLAMRIVGDADAAGLGDRLQPGGDIDAVAENVVVVDDDVADMDADAKREAAVLRHGRRCASAMRALNVDRAAHGVDGAGEFDQHAVAGGLDDAAAMFGDFRIDQRAPAVLEPRQSSLFVAPHEPAVTDDVRRKNGRQTALHAGACHTLSSIETRTPAARPQLYIAPGRSGTRFAVMGPAQRAEITQISAADCSIPSGTCRPRGRPGGLRGSPRPRATGRGACRRRRKPWRRGRVVVGRSAATLPRWSSLSPSDCTMPSCTGCTKPIASRTRSAGKLELGAGHRASFWRRAARNAAS